MISIQKTTKTPSQNSIKRDWKLIDVKGKVLGRVANEIATHLQGKNNVQYSPNLDMGDNVVVINARQVVVTGRKVQNKEYSFFSGYPGGKRTVTFAELIEKKPTEVIRHAVSGMLPKNKLRDRKLARLFIFADDKHNYAHKFSDKK